MPNNANAPFIYRLTVDGVPGALLSALSEPLAFTHTFALTGVHTVGIAVWNCTMNEGQAVTDTLQVTISEPGACVSLESITAPSVSGAFFGNR